MATLAESLISSTSRPLTLRMRPDLNARRHRYHGRTFWVVKEPVGLNYFRFHDEEFAILCMLDGRSSLDDRNKLASVDLLSHSPDPRFWLPISAGYRKPERQGAKA